MESERPGVKRSSAVIHFGNGASSPGLGRPRNLRHARTSSATPSAIFSRVTTVRGPLESADSAASVTTSATPPTTARPSSQPPRNAGPLVQRTGRRQDQNNGDDRQRADGDADRSGSITPIAPPTVLLRSPREPHRMRSRHSSDAPASPLPRESQTSFRRLSTDSRFERYKSVRRLSTSIRELRPVRRAQARKAAKSTSSSAPWSPASSGRPFCWAPRTRPEWSAVRPSRRRPSRANEPRSRRPG